MDHPVLSKSSFGNPGSYMHSWAMGEEEKNELKAAPPTLARAKASICDAYVYKPSAISSAFSI